MQLRKRNDKFCVRSSGEGETDGKDCLYVRVCVAPTNGSGPIAACVITQL